MKRRTWVIIIIITLLVLAPLFLYNLNNNESFLQASLINILTIFVAVIFSVILVQRQTDKRIQKEIFINLLKSLQDSISTPAISCCDKLKPEELLMWKREINNKVTLISKYKNIFKISSMVEKLEAAYKEYETCIDLYISKSKDANKNDLQRSLSLINQFAFDIMFELYN